MNVFLANTPIYHVYAVLKEVKKPASDPRGLEFQMVASHHVDAGRYSTVLGKSS